MDKEMVTVSIPVPPSFSVMEYVRELRLRPYRNDRDFRFDELINDLPVVMKKFHNDIVGKAILSHSYGEALAKDFREWVRGQLDESSMLEDAGASCVEYEG